MPTILDLEGSIEDAKNRLPSLIRAVESGEQVVITCDGRPIAQLAAPPPEHREARLGGMKGRIRLLTGWDEPITEEELLGEQSGASESLHAVFTNLPA